MKGTLRKTSEGIIFTIDERPSFGDLFYDTYLNAFVYNRVSDNANCYNEHKILASTFGVGLELKVNYKGKFQEILNGKYDGVEMDTEYPYTIQDNKVIIEL